MSETKLQAESRTEFGKGAARRIRRDAKVPAVLYGHGTAPVHVTLPGHETLMALKHGGANALLSIELEGSSQLVLPKQVQRDPIRGNLEHLDLIIVRQGEKVTVEIPIHVVGEADSGTRVSIENATISIEAEATHIPEAIEVSVEGAKAGTQILGKDLVLPEGATLHIDPEALVVNVIEAAAMESDAELAQAAEASATASTASAAAEAAAAS